MGGKLGRILVRSGYVTLGQIAIALEAQRRSRRPLASVMVDLGFITVGALTDLAARN